MPHSANTDTELRSSRFSLPYIAVEIKHFPHNDLPEADRLPLEQLFRIVWGDKAAGNLHPEEMQAVSFYAMQDHQALGYAGILSWTVRVRDRKFDLCGLSCVCTHPDYRRRGIGTALAKQATEWILRESNREGAYASDTLHLHVFGWLISRQAKQHADYFERGTITLDFPQRQFI